MKKLSSYPVKSISKIYYNTILLFDLILACRKKFPFGDNEFDLIYSRLGLHYFTQEELKEIFKELNRLTNKYLVFTVKLVNDIPTGKVIFTEDTWKDLVSEEFKIISAEVKEGILYNNQSKWLEIIAEK